MALAVVLEVSEEDLEEVLEEVLEEASAVVSEGALGEATSSEARMVQGDSIPEEELEEVDVSFANGRKARDDSERCTNFVPRLAMTGHIH